MKTDADPDADTDLNATAVERAIDEVDLSDLDVYSGDCVNIAVALQAVTSSPPYRSPDGSHLRVGLPVSATWFAVTG